MGLIGGSIGPKVFYPNAYSGATAPSELLQPCSNSSEECFGQWVGMWVQHPGGAGTLPPTYRSALGYFTPSRQLHGIGAGNQS